MRDGVRPRPAGDHMQQASASYTCTRDREKHKREGEKENMKPPHEVRPECL